MSSRPARDEHMISCVVIIRCVCPAGPPPPYRRGGLSPSILLRPDCNPFVADPAGRPGEGAPAPTARPALVEIDRSSSHDLRADPIPATNPHSQAPAHTVPRAGGSSEAAARATPSGARAPSSKATDHLGRPRGIERGSSSGLSLLFLLVFGRVGLFDHRGTLRLRRGQDHVIGARGSQAPRPPDLESPAHFPSAACPAITGGIAWGDVFGAGSSGDAWPVLGRKIRGWCTSADVSPLT